MMIIMLNSEKGIMTMVNIIKLRRKRGEGRGTMNVMITRDDT